MFGYVMVNEEELKIREFKRYRGYYCGLCRSLGRHGVKGRLFLTYDMTFLYLLLSGLYEKPLQMEKRRCLAHPARRQEMLTGEIADYAADMTVLLYYYKALDDVQDDGTFKAKAAVGALKKAARKAAEKYPRQANAIRENCEKLSRAEDALVYDLDTISGYTGKMLAELFVKEEDEWSDVLRCLGHYLGKFVYLLDAFEDLEEDQKKGEYNPWTPFAERRDFEALVENTLTLMAADTAREFERLPIVTDVDILRNILYSGIWKKYQMVKKKREEKAGSEV